MKIIDISLPIKPGMPIYPGTKETAFESVASQSGNSYLTNISISSHAGTHIDAPSHIKKGAASIDTFNLDKFYGNCRVIDLSSLQEKIDANSLRAKNIKSDERILLKTSNSDRGFDKFYDTWVGLSSKGGSYLSDCKVQLVGIDWLGIKVKNSSDNLAHSKLLQSNIVILEGLNLADVQEGEYILSAFPILYKGIDGAQARAVLIEM